MRRTLVAALALGLTGAVVPASAHGAAADIVYGGCGYETNSQGTVTGGQQVGTIEDLSVTTTGDVPPVPIDATVTCWIEVNEVEAPGTRFSYSGSGIQAGADRISYTAGDSDPVYMCQSVAFADGTTQTRCPMLDDQNLPPGWFITDLNTVFDEINAVADVVDGALVTYADPVLCPALVKLAGTYGPLTVEPDGDLDALDPLDLWFGPLYDCPPYGNF